MEKEYLTIKETAKILGVTPLTLRNWDKKGKLIAYRHPMNNYRVYRQEQIDELLKKLNQRRDIPRKLQVNILED